MKDRPFLENLDTSFVNLDALVGYLRRRKFVGSIRIEFTAYEGEIVFTPDGRLRVNECDRVAGLVTDAEKAFNRIMARAKEPGGRIDVVQSFHDTPQNKKSTVADIEKIAAIKPLVTNGHGKLRGDNGNSHHGRADAVNVAEQSPEAPRPNAKPFAAFPYELTNNFEEKARAIRAPLNEFDLMVDVASELLVTIDGALERAGLDFSAAFEKACVDLSGEYPFLDPKKRLFSYRSGVVYLARETDLQLLPDGLGAALARIFDRLRTSPKFGKVYRFTVQKVRFLMQIRKDPFDLLMLTPSVERALGVRD